MKRLIFDSNLSIHEGYRKRISANASILCTDVFEMSTDTSYYDNFLNPKDLKYMQDSKNLTGKVVSMSPNEYFQECANKIFENTTVDSLKHQREASRFRETNERFVDKYIQDMLNGDKFPLCYLNYADSSQEGLHRMYAAGEAFGWDTKFPVLVVTVYDEERQRKLDQRREFINYERYQFDDDVSDGIQEVTDWSIPVPNNAEDLITKAVESAAQASGHKIKVEVEFKEWNGGHKVKVWLISCDGYEPEVLSCDDDHWLEDIWDVGDDHSDELSEDDIDGVDLYDYLFDEED